MKKKDINKIIIHCSATREGDDSVNAEVIDRWHKARGWKGCGYHFVILIDGTIETGRMLDECGAKDTRTDAQKSSLLILLHFLKKLYPNTVIHGHRDFANKACPSFDATKEYATL